MQKTTLFWIATAGLSLLVLPFLWPLFKRRGHYYIGLFSSVGIIGLSYFCYDYWGNTAGLKTYYSTTQYAHRQKQAAMRPLLIQFRKAEQRYVLRIENNPKDREAWLNLGQIYLIQQDEARAAMAFERARAALTQ